MNETHLRLRRVRMKTGADVSVLRRAELGELHHALLRHARAVAESFGPELAGFFVIGWDKTGAFNSGSRIPYESAIPLSLFPAWLAEIARKEVVTSEKIRDVIRDEYQVTPPRNPPA